MLIVALLRAIRDRSNLSSVVLRGLRYSQMALLIQNLINKEYVKNKNGELLLTEKGECFIEFNVQKRNYRGIERWLSPQIQYRVAPIKKHDIILPRKI